MYNIRVQSINHFTVAEENDIAAANFAKSCLKAFRKRYGEEPQQFVCIHFASEETSESASSEEEGISVISKQVLTTLQSKTFTGTHYAFLMTHPLIGKKTSAHVGYSTNPMIDVHLHNTLTINDRTTSAAAPHWVLDMVVGPFISADVAIECSKELVSHTRGKDSKRRKAILLSRLYNVPLYSASVKPSVNLKEYLREKAPPHYLHIYEKMISGPKHIGHGAASKPKRHKKKKK